MMPAVQIHFVQPLGGSGSRASRSRQARSHAARVALKRDKSLKGTALKHEPKPPATTRHHSKKLHTNALSPTNVVAYQPPQHVVIQQDDPDDPASVEPETCLFSQISPGLGALSVSTAAPSTSLQGIHYMTQVFWPNFHMHGDDSILPLLKAYCDQPLFFHYLNYTAAVHCAILSNTVNRLATTKKLVHYQGKVIEILRNVIRSPNASSSERVPEWAITLVIALASMDYQQCLNQTDVEGFLFVPYMPDADWLNVFGRILPQDSHLSAMHTLVERAGGLHSLQFKGLRGRVAWADLVQASMNGRPPSTPCIWRETASIEPLLEQSPRTMEVIGKFQGVLGGLPFCLVATLQHLVALDGILAHTNFRALKNDAICEIKALRNIVEHGMLSLPTWMDLTSDERDGSIYAVYEIARIASTIYCQAVVFPLPPHSGWHLKLLKSLQDVVELSNILEWNFDTAEGRTDGGLLLDMVLWALTIAAIAARKTKMEAFFYGLLRKAIHQRQTHTTAGLQSVVSQFIWQECTCGTALDTLCADLCLWV